MVDHHQQEDDHRIAELILISTMYPTQLHLLDDDLKKAIDEQNFSFQFPQNITILIEINSLFELQLTMPIDYPKNDPNCLQIFCRLINDKIVDAKSIQKQLNERIKNEIDDMSSLITVVPKIIEICGQIKISEENKDTLTTTTTTTQKLDSTNESSKTSSLSRYWIYSHHIYSINKRRKIIDLCNNRFHLNGFMLIGKPGFICIEGNDNECNEFWMQIHSWNWQRITLIDMEKKLDFNSDQLFNTFTEYVNRSELFQLLKDKCCDKIIKEFLGFS